MATPKTDAVSRVYAEALVGLAEKNNELDELAEEVAALQQMAADSAELNKLFTSPVIGAADRTALVQRLFEGKTSDNLYKFIQVVNRKGRLAALPGICGAVAQIVAAKRGQIDVQVTVAQPLDDASAARVAQELGQTLGKTVNLHQTVDQSILGGMKLRIGDRLIDASVATRLTRIQHKLAAAGRAQAQQAAG